ncbi:MAG: 2-dehydropantoate 2-reductase [Anaerolineales bacterium]|nr:2-dehydropantoate 2-reductase [Anaerolineales bacterium]
MSSLRILTFGAGAIGTYIGGSLALAGHPVVFVERPEVAAELKQRGLRLDLTVDERRKTREPALVAPSDFTCVGSLPEALEHGPFDAALFALKSFDTAAALDGMAPHLDRLPPVLCLSNGVDNEPDLAAALGPGRVLAGTVTSSVGRRAAGDIVLERLRGVGVAALPEGSEAGGREALPARLVAALDAAGLNARLFPAAADMKWSKMLTNLPANVTAAILDMTAAEVFAHPGLFALEMRSMRETLDVMKAHAIRVVDLPGTPVRALAFACRLPAGLSRPLLARAVGGGRGGKMPSFHIDLHSGRGRSEVGWLNGAVARFGEQAGVPTPVNRALTEILIALTEGRIPLEAYARQPEKLLALN